MLHPLKNYTANQTKIIGISESIRYHQKRLYWSWQGPIYGAFPSCPEKDHTKWTFPGAFRKADIYPLNSKAVLDEIPLKGIEKGRLKEPSDGDSENLPATPVADTTFTPKHKQKVPGPIDTPQNTAVVQSHVVAALDELDSIAVQGIPSDYHA